MELLESVFGWTVAVAVTVAVMLGLAGMWIVILAREWWSDAESRVVDLVRAKGCCTAEEICRAVTGPVLWFLGRQLLRCLVEQGTLKLVLASPLWTNRHFRLARWEIDGDEGWEARELAELDLSRERYDGSRVEWTESGS